MADNKETANQAYGRLRQEFIDRNKGDYGSTSKEQQRLRRDACDYAYKTQNPYCHLWNKW